MPTPRESTPRSWSTHPAPRPTGRQRSMRERNRSPATEELDGANSPSSGRSLRLVDPRSPALPNQSYAGDRTRRSRNRCRCRTDQWVGPPHQHRPCPPLRRPGRVDREARGERGIGHIAGRNLDTGHWFVARIEDDTAQLAMHSPAPGPEEHQSDKGVGECCPHNQLRHARHPTTRRPCGAETELDMGLLSLRRSWSACHAAVRQGVNPANCSSSHG